MITIIPGGKVTNLQMPPVSSSIVRPSALVVNVTASVDMSVRAGICALMSIHAGTDEGVAAPSASAAAAPRNAIVFLIFCSLSLRRADFIFFHFYGRLSYHNPAFSRKHKCAARIAVTEER